jgi:outer membrane protein assembly factor BamB
MRKVACSSALFLSLTFLTAFAQQPGTARWTVKLGEWVTSSPAIAEDGTVYFVGSSGAEGYRLAAVRPDGSFRWQLPIIGDVKTALAIGPDGTIYVATSTSHLLAIRADGTEKWDFQAGDSVRSSPAIGADGAIYFGCQDRQLYALNPNGTVRWTFPTGGYVRSPPVIGADGTIYVGSDDRKCYALAPDGSRKWEFATGQPLPLSPALDADGSVYLAANDGRVYALKPDGSRAWTNRTDVSQTSPVIGKDRRLYLGLWKSAGAFGLDGSTNWIVDLRERINASPAAADDGTVYFSCGDEGSETGALVALRPDGTRLWEFKPGVRFSEASPVIGPDGTIYVGSNNRAGGYLHAVWGSSGPAQTAWPMDRQGARRRGALPPGGAPVIIVPPAERTVANGSNVVIEVTATGAPPLTYQWLRNGRNLADACNLSGSQSPALRIESALFGDAGDYSVVIMNTSGAITSQVARLTVLPGFIPSGTRLWEAALPGAAVTSPALGPGGVAYVIAQTATDWVLCACETNGAPGWTLALGAQTLAAPAIAADGTIYLGTGWPSNRCLAITAGGAIKWSLDAGSSINVSSALALDGTVYYASTAGRLLAVKPEGVEAWHFETGGHGYISAPAVGADGTVYLGSGHGDEALGYTVGVFHAVRPDGTERWRFSARGPFVGDPAIAPNGTIYFGSLDNEGAVYAFAPEGTNLWKYFTRAAIITAPAIAADGTVYIANMNHRLFSLRPNGATNWVVGVPGGSTPVLGLDGTVHAPTGSGGLVTFTGSGKPGWTYAEEGAITPAVLDAAGRLYFGARDRLVCIQASAPPPLAGWPMVGREPRHSANAAVSLPIPAPAPLNPAITNGSFSFGLHDILGGCLLIEQSEDLQHWQAVATNRAPAVIEQAVDPNGRRFYRLRPLQE